LLDAVLGDIRRAYDEREAYVNSRVLGSNGRPTGDGMRRLERLVMLDVLDRRWREHLYEMDYLKDGIGLRAMAQRDPLIEYQREGYDMFNAMLDALKEECITMLFKAQVAEPEQAPAPAQVGAAARIQQAVSRATQASQQQQPQQPQAPAGRRQPPPPQEQIPPALRGNQQQSQQYTYSGPAEGGGVQSRGGGQQPGNGQKPGGAGGSSSRRERRAAARDAQKKGRKGTRR
jgi:preprotein translocase subunit SecA